MVRRKRLDFANTRNITEESRGSQNLQTFGGSSDDFLIGIPRRKSGTEFVRPELLFVQPSTLGDALASPLDTVLGTGDRRIA
jgi:hypothetical protein